jgi:hypothetical protein
MEPCSAQAWDLGERFLGDAGVVLVVTLRRDGSRRLSPVEPLFWREDLWLMMMLKIRQGARSRKRSPRPRPQHRNQQGWSPREYKDSGGGSSWNPTGESSVFVVDAAKARLSWKPELGRFHLITEMIRQEARVTTVKLVSR